MNAVAQAASLLRLMLIMLAAALRPAAALVNLCLLQHAVPYQPPLSTWWRGGDLRLLARAMIL